MDVLRSFCGLATLLLGLVPLAQSAVPAPWAEVGDAEELFGDDRVMARGVVRPDEGTIEVEAELLFDAKELMSHMHSYSFIFRMKATGEAESPSGAGLVFCTAFEPRAGLLWITKKSTKRCEIIQRDPPIKAAGLHKYLVKWGGGKSSLWVDGVKVGEKACDGLGGIPAHLVLGCRNPSFGGKRVVTVKAFKISDLARDDGYCARKDIAAPDGRTTLARIDGKLFSSLTDWQRDVFKGEAIPCPDLIADPQRYAADPIQIPFYLTNFSDKPIHSAAKAFFTDLGGARKQAGQMDFDIAPGTYYTLTQGTLPAVEDTGLFDFSLELPDGDGVRSVFLPKYVSLPERYKALKPGRFASVLGYQHRFKCGYSDPFLNKGLDWSRGLDPRFFMWSLLEPEKGVYNWKQADEFVARCAKEGIKVLPVLGYPPKWASAWSPAEQERLAQMPVNKGNPYLSQPERYKPRDLKEWDAFLRVLVKRYSKQIKHWEIYNEIDFMPPFFAATFTGTAEDYLDLLKVAYKAIKETDPEAKVLISGFNLGHSGNKELAVQLMQMGAAPYFDIFNLHGYCDNDTSLQALTAARKAKPSVEWWMTEICFVHRLNESKDAPLSLDKVKAGTQQHLLHLLWSLEQDVKVYFWHSEEFDQSRRARPEFAALCNLWALVRAADEFLGPVKDSRLPAWLKAWRLKLTNGDNLYVLSASQTAGRVTASLKTKDGSSGDVFASGLLAETLTVKDCGGGRSELAFSNMAYLLSAKELEFVSATRSEVNLVENGGFEDFGGDVYTSWDNAWPQGWKASGNKTSTGKMALVKDAGVKGVALKLSTTPEKGKKAAVAQRVPIDAPGKYTLDCSMRNLSPKPANVSISYYDDSMAVPSTQLRTATLGAAQKDFGKISMKISLDASPNCPPAVIISLDSPDAQVLLDDVSLFSAQ